MPVSGAVLAFSCPESVCSLSGVEAHMESARDVESRFCEVYASCFARTQNSNFVSESEAECWPAGVLIRRSSSAFGLTSARPPASKQARPHQNATKSNVYVRCNLSSHFIAPFKTKKNEQPSRCTRNRVPSKRFGTHSSIRHCQNRL